MKHLKLFEGFESIFDRKYTYQDKVKSSLLNLLMNEYGISEKAFNKVDNLIEQVRVLIDNEDIKNIISEFEKEKKRNEYCAETIFDQYLKNNKLI